MASFNRVILMGNLTRDPEIRYIPSGTAVSDIGLAVNDRRKGPNGDWIEETTFVDVTLWGRTAEVANEYLSKGSPILIEGRLKLDSWEKDGQKHSKLKVIGERMQMVGPRQGGQGQGGGGGGARGGSRAPQPSGPGYDNSDFGQGDFEPREFSDAPAGAGAKRGAPQQQGEDGIPF
jgi:single-strand DNA-binding protein